MVVLQHHPHVARKNPYSDRLVSESKLVFGFSEFAISSRRRRVLQLVLMAGSSNWGAEKLGGSGADIDLKSFSLSREPRAKQGT